MQSVDGFFLEINVFLLICLFFCNLAFIIKLKRIK